MNENIDLIVFGTFGIPNGFRQTSALRRDQRLSGIKTFDLNTNAINIFPDSKVYSIRKEYVNGDNIISYAVYSFAKEKNSNRGGTFIGASIVFYNQIAPENLTLEYLNEFNEALITNVNNVENNIIQVNHSDRFEVSKNIKDFDKVKFNLREVEEVSFASTNRDLVIYALIKPELFEKSLELLNIYDTIFFTKSQEVAKFAHEKGLLRVIRGQDEFDNEIQSYKIQKEEEKKRKLNQTIEKLQRDIDLFDTGREQYVAKNKTLIEGKLRQIEDNRLQLKKYQTQMDNDILQIESSQKTLVKINEKFGLHKNELCSAIKDLKSGSRQLPEVLMTLEKSGTNIEEIKRELVFPTINKFYTSSSLTGSKSGQLSQQYYSRRDVERRDDNDSSTSTLYWIIAMLIIFWVSTIMYFLFFNEGKTPLKTIF